MATKRGLGFLLIFLLGVLCSSVVFAAQNATTTSNVFILNSNPVVRAIASTDPAEVGVTTLFVTANITDPNGVPNDIGTVVLTLSNGTASTADDYTVYMSYNATSTLYQNSTFKIPAHTQIGSWNLSFNATDNFGGSDVNSTTITVQDTVVPAVFNPQPPEGTAFAQGSGVHINATVYDNGTISVAYAEVFWPGSASNTTLTDSNSDDVWNASFSTTTTVGRYNITFFFNDTGNNINNTITTYFLVGDTTNPVVENLTVTSSPVDPGNTINFTVDVTDNVAISRVLAEINYTNYTMIQDGGNKWYYDQYNTYIPPGTYPIRIYANDTTNNVNGTTNTTFTVNTLVSIALQNTPVDFGNTTVGVSDRHADNGTGGNGYLGTGTARGYPLVVNVTGNINLNLSINGTALVGQTNPAYSIGAGNITYNVTTGLPGTAMSSTITKFASNVVWSTTQNLYFWIDIPTGLPQQAYQGTIQISSEQS